MREERFVQKPTWLPQKTWGDLLANYNYMPACKNCPEQDPLLMTVDHIVPRYLGGTDDLSNLQFLCFRCNTKKGIRGDRFWSQSFYFDNAPDLTKFRTAQHQEGYEKMLSYAVWFGRPFSQISRIMYLLAWIVASGKTLAIPAITCGLNYLIRRDCGPSVPRADRILVLSKEQSNRDGMASDLSEDIVRYGIFDKAPRVSVITQGWQWKNPNYLDTKDVVCACVQQLWEEDGRPRPDLQKILAYFPVIFFDEPHYALDQALAIVEAANSSLCFGLTGTPIYATGKTIKSFVLFSLYDYKMADEYDRSLKWLTDDEKELGDFLEEVQIAEADMLINGESSTTNNTDSVWYAKNIVPAKSVAERVVQYVSDRDKESRQVGKPAPHRTRGERAVLHYPVHAMIRVESIPVARTICDTLNKMFQLNRTLYPPEKGYKAAVVCSDTVDAKGEKLTPTHPWMLAKRNEGKLTPQSVRFLLVVGMGREGINNPLCGVVGLACRADSVIEYIQRILGRQMRAVTQDQGDLFAVPPARLDTPKIITHAAFIDDKGSNRQQLIWAMKFLCNMPEHLADIPTMEDLKKDRTPLLTTTTGNEEMLTGREKIVIACRIGEHKLHGEDIPIDDIVQHFGGQNKEHRKRVKEWIQDVKEDPPHAWKQITRYPFHDRRPLPAAEIVKREYTISTPTDEDLNRFVHVHKPHLAAYLTPGQENPGFYAALRALFTDHVHKFHTGDIEPRENLEHIRKRLFGEVLGPIDGHFTGENKDIHGLVGHAVKCVLGVPDGQQAKVGGDWDIPQCHSLLNRPEIRRSIVGYVRTQLMYQGKCPTLAAAFNITPDQEEEERDAS